MQLNKSLQQHPPNRLLSHVFDLFSFDISHMYRFSYYLYDVPTICEVFGMKVKVKVKVKEVRKVGSKDGAKNLEIYIKI